MRRDRPKTDGAVDEWRATRSSEPRADQCCTACTPSRGRAWLRWRRGFAASALLSWTVVETAMRVDQHTRLDGTVAWRCNEEAVERTRRGQRRRGLRRNLLAPLAAALVCYVLMPPSRHRRQLAHVSRPAVRRLATWALLYQMVVETATLSSTSLPALSLQTLCSSHSHVPFSHKA